MVGLNSIATGLRRTALIPAVFLLLTIILAGWHNNRRPRAIALLPSLTNQPEYCLSCHQDLPEISRSHPFQAFGCVLCHGGERLSLEADLAHRSMRGGRNPSDLTVAQDSCGGSNCHTGEAAQERNHVQRVLTSVQATYAGAIANLRYSFGAQPDLTARMGIFAIRDEHIQTPTGLPGLEAFAPENETNPGIQAFAQNCLNCHLSAEPLPGEETSRLTGCAACHSLTAGDDLDQPLHSLTLKIPYTQCNTCHNRGNYDLRNMHFVPRSDKPQDRLHDYYQPIAQFVRCEWTLDCIDCHTRYEIMGDGDLHSNQREIRYIQCRTCHGTLDELPLTRTITDPEDLALRMSFLNPVIDLGGGDTVLVSSRGEPLWNTRRLADGSYELFGKASGQRFTFRAVKGSACQQNTAEQESRYCHECHAVER